MASSSAVGKLSREDFRRQKDLEAARKAGTAPAELDEKGRPINPHIPQYISKAPWYLDTGGPSLDHQRRPEEQDRDKEQGWYARGQRAGPAATKYRKGACENCGAMTHKTRDCLERPRKKGAKWTGKGIAADEIVQNLELGYDAKRDRWNGYDPSEHKRVYDEYQAVEEARRRLKEDEIDNQTATDLSAVKKVAKVGKEGKEDAEFGSSDEEDEDEEKYAEGADQVGQKLDTKTRITVRNLRIREDTAKYLLNLDPESAYYDPKTRSMRDNPLAHVAPEDAVFAGENFMRLSGEAPDVQKLQLFAWQAEQRGNDVDLQANPTQGELMHRQYKEKKELLKDTTKTSLLSKYGGEQYLEKVPKELLTGQTEEYVEYSANGQVIKGREKAKVRSKYREDEYVNNHTSVWGSWYDIATSSWGFACCHSTIHASYCAGSAAIEAASAASVQELLARPREEPEPVKTLAEEHAERLAKDGEDAGRSGKDPKKRLGEGDLKLDQDKLQKAILDEKKRKKRDAEEDEWESKKRRTGDTGEVSEEQLEAYRMNRLQREDPMANYRDEEA
ncbi:pre-mRNA-splicing factor SLU7 [Calocera viscosa TUFC12733]|uniref:Pre-mRNA-splicing factor SLU7 n=1 Tax=Calocera viscosa (strain TUFC12733) TaxID=1330018 RepID=A0A167PI16_CALVF|nr:pre-mRNA-splicing factor SLU7 [Calocera viscosa TUFC12733]